MRKKKIIISIVVVMCVLVCSFFIMRFGVIGNIRNAINKPVVKNKAESEEEVQEEVKYETRHAKDANEFVVEMRKIIGVVDENGNEVETWEDTEEPITIYNNIYEGTLDKIEGNKIYFNVNKIVKGDNSDGEDVKGHQIIFDIDTYSVCASPIIYNESSEGLCGDIKFFHSADELEFLVGKYFRVHDVMEEDYYTCEKYKGLFFQ